MISVDQLPVSLHFLEIIDQLELIGKASGTLAPFGHPRGVWFAAIIDCRKSKQCGTLKDHLHFLEIVLLSRGPSALPDDLENSHPSRLS